MTEVVLKKFKWQQEALAKRRVVVRAARRSGKTLTALEWARSATGKVLYVTPYETMAHHAFEQMSSHYKGLILSTHKRPHRIIFKDGTEVHFTSSIDSLRGARYDAVVIEEASYMNEDHLILALATVADRINFPFFLTHTKDLGRGITRRLKKIEQVAAIDYIMADYLDLLEDGIYLASGVRAAQRSMNRKVFEEEYGPWLSHEDKPCNIFFKHMLDKERT